MHRLVYLDNHATTRCDPRVVDAMHPVWSEQYGNAGSRGHAFGLAAQALVERARDQVAAWAGADARDVLFTSGATESNNLALLGVGRAFTTPRHLITAETEHRAVLDPVVALERAGWRVTRIPPDGDGRVAPDALAAAMRPDTALVSLMAVNNEIGVVQDVAGLAAVARAGGALFHTDAAQAGAAVRVAFARDGVDLMSVSGHKMYGPKGIGALLVRRGRPRIAIEPLVYGGGQERGLRSGTVPVPLVVGLGASADLARADLDADAPAALASLRDRLAAGVLAIGGVVVNGCRARRHPGNLHITVDGVDAAALLAGLRDLALSTGSACASATLAPSHVLRALYPDAPERGHRSVRFGLGRFTTVDEVDYAVARFAEVVPRLRALGAV